jgi:peptide chain release factor subunit 1
MHHLKETADKAFALLQGQDFDQLYVAGTDDVVSEFIEYLHPYLREKLAGTFPMEMVSTATEVQDQTMIAALKLGDQRHEELIASLRAEVHTGNLGAAGLEDTLHTLLKGQVLTLLVNDDFVAPGHRCTACGLLSITSPCPFCGGDTEPLEDIVEYLVAEAFLRNCEIAFVEGDNREQLAQLGGIGALLRFVD